MNIEVKNPVYLILLNWIILLIGYLGIPLLPLTDVSEFKRYILSFIIMNFHFVGTYSKPIILLVGWSISIGIFGIFVKSDWKIPILGILTEGMVYLFSIILLKRHSEATYSLLQYDLLKGYAVASLFIILLYIPIIVRHFVNKKKQKEARHLKTSPYISKCPYCGQEFQSNPSICYSCSKQIISS
jgi:hypothetical protein